MLSALTPKPTRSTFAGLVRALHRLPQGSPLALEKGLCHPFPLCMTGCGGYLLSLGGRAPALPCSRPAALSHPPLLEKQTCFEGSPDCWRGHPYLVAVVTHPLNPARVGCQLVFALRPSTTIALGRADHRVWRCFIPAVVFQMAEVSTCVVVLAEALAARSAAGCHGVRDRAPRPGSVAQSV